MSEEAWTAVAVGAPVAIGEEMESCVRGYHVLLKNLNHDILMIFLPAGLQVWACTEDFFVVLKLAIDIGQIAKLNTPIKCTFLKFLKNKTFLSCFYL